MSLVKRLRAAAPGTMLSMQVSDLAALREAADEIERLTAALEGALVVLESMPRPTAGLVSNEVQKAFDKRLEAVHAALSHQQEVKDRGGSDIVGQLTKEK